MSNKRTPGRCEGCGVSVPPPLRKCKNCKRATARSAARRRAGRSVVYRRGGMASPSYYWLPDRERDAIMAEDDRGRLADSVEVGAL